MNNEPQLKWLEQELHLWNKRLNENKDLAMIEIDKTLKRIQGKYHYTDLARFKASMLNGTSTPQDYTLTRVAHP